MFIEQIPGRCIIPLKGVFVHLADILEDWSTMQSFVRQCCQISLFAKNTKDKKNCKSWWHANQIRDQKKNGLLLFGRIMFMALKSLSLSFWCAIVKIVCFCFGEGWCLWVRACVCVWVRLCVCIVMCVCVWLKKSHSTISFIGFLWLTICSFEQ